MRGSNALLRLIVLTLLAAACGTNEPDASAFVRVMHVRDGAPPMDLLVNGETVLQDVAFSEASEFAEVRPGTATLAMRPVAGGTPLSTTTSELTPGARYTLLFSGAADEGGLRLAPDTAAGVPLTPPPTEPGDTGAIPGESKIKVRVIHNASDAPPLDVYLSLDGDSFGFPLVEPFTYGLGLDPEFPGYVERDPGVWRVRFTADGTEDIVLDTGPISMLAGQVRSVILFSADTTGLGIAIVRER